MEQANNDQLTAVGQLIRAARERRRVALKAAATAAGISTVTWRRVERGQSTYGPTHEALENWFGLPSGALSKATDGATTVDDFALELEEAVLRSLEGVGPDLARLDLAETADLVVEVVRRIRAGDFGSEGAAAVKALLPVLAKLTD
ncbi:helix-turn-helix domain-containing protein [Amycolatopsis sp. H20-H5]|uniref:helix-turn-helix domain-containing protein n=1 Tax=Amycolatopsis sp. H20-H5 TaxID=3046309 RepID=UPI002DBCB878|nr:helix-turn-helix domain-containing protein [Amycolatopsis sp. H20-H5]MEC3974758.1 helix-turn-helix domain-containing protein [Amycolatopsis sp. H20-H5]